MSKVTIAGAGIGGLCTGIRLLKEGHEVTIYEKNSYVGGCIHYYTFNDEFKIDEGPSLAINPLTYDKIFYDSGKNPRDYFKWLPLENNYKVLTYNNKAFNLSCNLIKTQENLKKYYPEDVEGYGEFILDTTKKYLLAKDKFLNKPFIHLRQIYKISNLKAIKDLSIFTSANDYLKRYIKSKELRQIILFQTFFMGISPYEIPAIYTSIAANTQIEGLRHIEGGLSAYVRALEKLYLQLGGKLQYNCEIKKIIYKRGKIKGLICEEGFINSNKVIINTDYITSQKTLLQRNCKKPYKLSCSTIVFHLGLSKLYKELEVHNLFLNKSFEKEVKRVFKGRLPSTPSIYIYYPSSIDKSFCKNSSYSVMNVMIRVPNLKEGNILWEDKVKSKLYNIALKILKEIPGLKDIEEHILGHKCTTPKDFERQYGYYGGSCFGLGHSFCQSMIFRPQIKDKEIKDLYYVGASIHPGNGASIVMDCAKMVAKEFNSRE